MNLEHEQGNKNHLRNYWVIAEPNPRLSTHSVKGLHQGPGLKIKFEEQNLRCQQLNLWKVVPAQ